MVSQAKICFAFTFLSLNYQVFIWREELDAAAVNVILHQNQYKQQHLTLLLLILLYTKCLQVGTNFNTFNIYLSLVNLKFITSRK